HRLILSRHASDALHGLQTMGDDIRCLLRVECRDVDLHWSSDSRSGSADKAPGRERAGEIRHAARVDRLEEAAMAGRCLAVDDELAILDRSDEVIAPRAAWAAHPATRGKKSSKKRGQARQRCSEHRPAE